MESPVRGIRFIHEAINREAADLARLAKSGPLDSKRIALFKKILSIHAKGEEVGLFPAIEKRAADVVAPYLLDHREEEHLLEELEGKDPHAAAVRLAEHLRLHIKKENEILGPLLERILTPEEQLKHVGEMMAVFTPADMGEILPWMITWLDTTDRRAYVGILAHALPPERLQGILGLLKAKLAPDVWETLGR
jgi:hemerythrin superfamily protein